MSEDTAAAVEQARAKLLEDLDCGYAGSPCRFCAETARSAEAVFRADERAKYGALAEAAWEAKDYLLRIPYATETEAAIVSHLIAAIHQQGGK